jgi:hypothetical protein
MSVAALFVMFRVYRAAWMVVVEVRWAYQNWAKSKQIILVPGQSARSIPWNHVSGRNLVSGPDGRNPTTKKENIRNLRYGNGTQ